MRPLGTLMVQEQSCPEGKNAGKFGLDKLPLADPLRVNPQAEKEMYTALQKLTTEPAKKDSIGG